MEDSMKIIELRAENFKRLKAVTIRPNGALVEVTGANGNGKTSVLDAIWAGLKGRAAGIVEPIRKGAERATIELKLGNGKVAYDVVRTFRRDKHGDVTVDLTVTAGDGSAVRKTPQAVLDSFIGALSFDPLAFARAAPKDQFEVLKAFVPGFDFEANTEKRKQAFDARTDANRRPTGLAPPHFLSNFPGPKAKARRCLEETRRDAACRIPQREHRGQQAQHRGPRRQVRRDARRCCGPAYQSRRTGEGGEGHAGQFASATQSHWKAYRCGCAARRYR